MEKRLKTNGELLDEFIVYETIVDDWAPEDVNIEIFYTEWDNVTTQNKCDLYENSDCESEKCYVLDNPKSTFLYDFFAHIADKYEIDIVEKLKSVYTDYVDGIDEWIEENISREDDDGECPKHYLVIDSDRFLLRNKLYLSESVEDFLKKIDIPVSELHEFLKNERHTQTEELYVENIYSDGKYPYVSKTHWEINRDVRQYDISDTLEFLKTNAREEDLYTDAE